MGPVLGAIGSFIAAVFVGTASANLYYVLAVNLARIGALALIAKLTSPKLDISDIALRKTVTIRDPVAPQKFVYGEDLVSGPIIFSNTSGDENRDLNIVIALTGHEIDSVVKYRIDSRDIPLSDLSGAEDGTFDTGFFAGTGRVDIRHGDLTQAAISDLTTTFSSLFNAAHTGRGWSYMNWKFQLVEGSEDVYKNQPQNIRALVRGYEVYDPRDDTGGAGDDPQNPAFISWSDNPALCLAHFMTDTKFGMGEEDDRIDWDDVETAADICDATVSIPGPSTQARYTCNVTFEATMQRSVVRDELLGAMMGRMVFSQGKWKMWAGAAIAADVTLTEANLNGAITLETGTRTSDRYNRVRGKYVDKDKDYTVASYPEARSSTYVSEDAGEVLIQVADFTSTNEFFEAQRKSIITLKQSRNQRVVVFQGNYSCFRIQPGSTVDITIDEYGFTGEKFFVTEWKFTDTGVELTLVEEVDSVWADPLVGDYATRSATGVLTFTDTGVPPPTGITAAPLLQGILVQWTNPPLQTAWKYIEVHASSDNVRGNAVIIAQTPHEQYIEVLNQANRETRYYWVRAVNEFGQVSTFEPDLTTTTATSEPNRDVPTWIVDPEFILAGDDPGPSNDHWSETIVQGTSPSQTGDIVYQASAGQEGDAAYDFIPSGGTGGLVSLKSDKWTRFTGKGVFIMILRYQTVGSADALDHEIVYPLIGTRDEEFGGVVNFTGARAADIPRSASYRTIEFVIDDLENFSEPTSHRYISFGLQWGQVITGDQGTLDTLRIDSIQVIFQARSFGDVDGSPGQVSKMPGMVPKSLTADEVKFLKGDGTWADPSASPSISTEQYAFDASTAAADPGDGDIRFDNATLASVTNLYIDDLNQEGGNNDTLFGFLKVGNRIHFEASTDPAKAAVFEVSSAPTDNTGWWTVPVTVVDSDTLPAAADILNVTVHWNTVGSGALDDLTDVDLTGAADNDLLYRSGGNWIDTAGRLTWDGGNFRIWDSGLTDYLEMGHDQTDFNFTFGNTTDWNITGITQTNLPGTLDVAVAVQTPNLRFDVDNSGGADGFISLWDHGAVNRWNTQLSINDDLQWVDVGAGVVAFQLEEGGAVAVASGKELRVYDSSGNDYMAANHTGANFVFDFVNTGEVSFTGYTGNVNLGISVLANKITTTGTGAFLRVQDPLAGDYVTMTHDSTDFTMEGFQTVDFNITGITGDFDVVNYRFAVNQAVGAGQDNYVLTYDDGTGEISLEAAAGGGGDMLLGTVQSITAAKQFNDDVELRFGTGNDVRVDWDGTDLEWRGGANYIWNFRDGAELRLWESTDVEYTSFHTTLANTIILLTAGSNFIVRNGAEEMIQALANGETRLYYNGVLKLNTLTGGVDVAGDITATQHGGITEANLLDKTAAETISNDWLWGDNDQIRMGDSNDARIYFTGTTTNLELSGAANIFNLRVNGAENALIATPNAGVALYYNNNQKFTTTNTGLQVNGDIWLDGDNDELQLGALAGGDTRFYFSGSETFIDCIGGSNDFQVRVNGTEEMIRADVNGVVTLSWNGTSAMRTADRTASAAASALQVWDQQGDLRHVGFTDMDSVTKSSAITLGAEHCHKTIRITNVTGSITFPNEADIQVDSVGWIVNTTTSNQTLAATSNNLEVFSGDAVANDTGNMTLAGKGWCTWHKVSSTEFELVGVGLS